MNPNQVLTEDEPNVVEFSENPGRRLRVARQSRGLEIERIAAQLHLRPGVVDAIEQDRYAELPGPVFVSGYIRNYARLLGLDPEPLIAAYRAANASDATDAPRVPVPPGAEIGGGHVVFRLISLALVVGVVASLVLWWQDRGGTLEGLLGAGVAPGSVILPEQEQSVETAEPLSASSGDPTPTVAPGQPETGTMNRAAASAPIAPLTMPEPTPAPRQTSDNAPAGAIRADEIKPGERAANEAPTALPMASAPSPAEAPALATPAADQSESATDAEPASPAPEASEPATGVVALSFSGPCWIDVRDATGKVILNGEMGKGDERVLDGNPPYSFVVGNAKATTITVSGQPFDLSSRAKGNVARFKLDPDADA